MVLGSKFKGPGFKPSYVQHFYLRFFWSFSCLHVRIFACACPPPPPPRTVCYRSPHSSINVLSISCSSLIVLVVAIDKVLVCPFNDCSKGTPHRRCNASAATTRQPAKRCSSVFSLKCTPSSLRPNSLRPSRTVRIFKTNSQICTIGRSCSRGITDTSAKHLVLFKTRPLSAA